MCKKEYKKQGAFGTSTLKRHLEKKHPEELHDVSIKQPRINEFLQSKSKYPSNSVKKKRIDEKLAEFLAKDMRPVNMVEGPGFSAFIQELDDKYEIPSSRALSRTHLPSLLRREREKLLKELEEVRWVGITTDMWSSRVNSAFLNMTIHFVQGQLETRVLACERFPERHTGDNLKVKFLEVLEEFKLAGKVVATTIDNAPNMKNAVKGAGMTELSCFAHSLNLCAQYILEKEEDLKAVRNKIKETVKGTRTSHSQKVEFENCQRRLGMKVKALIPEVKTRWNSSNALSIIA